MILVEAESRRAQSIYTQGDVAITLLCLGSIYGSELPQFSGLGRSLSRSRDKDGLANEEIFRSPLNVPVRDGSEP